MSRPLADKVVLVTGAAKRIGRAVALAFAQEGAEVVITYRGSSREAEETVAALIAAGSRSAFCLQMDVTDPGSVQDAVEKVEMRMGCLDVLVNNAGAFETAVLERITPEQWDAMFATNTRGPFLVAQACHGALKASKGRIINIGSLGGLQAWPTHGHYCTSKAALHMLSQTMAKAWAPEISVNCVAPGMIVHGEVDPAYEHFAQKTPMKRNGTGDDVAAAVLFFATGPHFITGQLMAVDGGLGL